MAGPQNHTGLEEKGGSALSSLPSRRIQGGADQGLQRPCPIDGQPSPPHPGPPMLCLPRGRQDGEARNGHSHPIPYPDSLAPRDLKELEVKALVKIPYQKVAHGGTVLICSLSTQPPGLTDGGISGTVTSLFPPVSQQGLGSPPRIARGRLSATIS